MKTKYEIKAYIDNWYVVLLLFGAYLMLMVPTFLRLPFFLFTVPLRYALLLYGLVIIFVRSVEKKRLLYLRFFLIAFFIFWFLFVVRVFYNLEIELIYNYVFESNFGYYQAIFYCVVTTFSFCFLKKLDFRIIGKYVWLLLVLACVISLFFNLGSAADELQKSGGRFEGAQGMSSIDYGHNGVSLALVSIYYFFETKKSEIIFKLLTIASFLLGLFVVYLSGSRSPFVALLVCLFVYQILRNGIMGGGIILLICIFPFIYYYDAIVFFLDQFGGNFIERILASLDGSDKGGRDSLIVEGFKQFLEAPFFGDSFLMLSGEGRGAYVHNIFLEVLMSVGVLGFIFFCYCFFSFIKHGKKIIKNRMEMGWIYILFIQYTIFSMLSLTVYTNTKFWYLGVLIVIGMYFYKEKINNEKSSIRS